MDKVNSIEADIEKIRQWQQSQQPEIQEDIEKRIIGELFEWVKVTDKMSINRMEFGKVAKHLSTALQQKGNNDSDAVEFAEWTCHKGYIGYLNGDSYYWYDKSGEGIGTAYDLYKLFKQSKKINE